MRCRESRALVRHAMRFVCRHRHFTKFTVLSPVRHKPIVFRAATFHPSRSCFGASDPQQINSGDTLFVGAAATPLQYVNDPRRGRRGSMKYPA
jgi:hypothetical protein